MIRRIDALWRMEAARVVGALARTVGDLGLAEDLAHDALVAALQQWPRDGVPESPAAWLTSVARRRWIDGVRREAIAGRAVGELGRRVPATTTPIEDLEFESHVADDVLRLIFTACHPILTMDARVALSLKVLAGLSTGEIARAFLVPPATMAQRIVRAKRTLHDAGIPSRSRLATNCKPGSVRSCRSSI